MFGDLPLIADTNVWSKVRRAPLNLRTAFGDALREGQILGSPVIRLEWLHDAQEVEEFKRRDRLFSVGLRELALTQTIADAAVSALRELADISPGYHRVGLADALIAATAQYHGVNVLQDNPGDFSKLAEVMVFDPVRFGPVT